MLELTIDRAVAERFPAIRSGAFVVEGLERVAVTPADLDAAWVAAAAALADRSVRTENVAEAPNLRDWRRAFGECGVKPSSVRSSVEALVRRVLKDGRVATPLPIVDLYCAISVRHLAPLGVCDLDRTPGDAVVLRHARPASDAFEPLGGRAEDMPLGERIVVYAAGDLVLCYLFNHRDSSRTSLRADTRRAAFFAEAVSEGQHAALASSLESLRGELASRGATVGPVRVASASQPAVVLGLS